VKHTTLLCFTVALMLASALPAAAQSGGNELRFGVMPYLWLPTIDATSSSAPPTGTPR
jgi:hypothetical protein